MDNKEFGMIFLQAVVIFFCLLLAGYGFFIGYKGARIEEQRDNNRGRGLRLIVIGGGLMALAALIMTIAAKLLG